MKIGSSKLIKLIRGLSSTELNGFAEYAKSRIHNSHEKVTGLAELLLKANGRYDIEGSIIYKKLFGDEKYSRPKLGHVMSYTLKLLEDYLASLYYKSNNFYSGLFLLEELNTKSLDDFIPGTYGRIKKSLEGISLRDREYYKNMYELQAVYNSHMMKGEVTKRPGDSHKRAGSLQEKADALDLYYLHARLEYSCQMALMKKTASVQFRSGLSEEILSHVKKYLHTYDSHPGIQIYYYILLILTDSANDAHLHSLLSLLDKYREKFSLTDLRKIYFYVVEFYLSKIVSGSRDHVNDLFSLYKLLLERNLLRLHDGYINQWDYLTIVGTGTSAKKYKWTKKFIEEYKDFLHPSYRKNVYRYNLALYYSYTDPKTAQQILRDLEFESLYYRLGTKSILLRIYYDTNNAELFFYHTNTFASFLKRNKLVSAYQKKIHTNFLKFTKKAFDIRQSGNSKAKEKLLEQIKQTKTVSNLQWLMEKVNEL